MPIGFFRHKPTPISQLRFGTKSDDPEDPQKVLASLIQHGNETDDIQKRKLLKGLLPVEPMLFKMATITGAAFLGKPLSENRIQSIQSNPVTLQALRAAIYLYELSYCIRALHPKNFGKLESEEVLQVLKPLATLYGQARLLRPNDKDLEKQHLATLSHIEKIRPQEPPLHPPQLSLQIEQPSPQPNDKQAFANVASIADWKAGKGNNL
jgi:hypothetical protein